MDLYNCVIVGGGASGLMAGIAAASSCSKVLLLDKGDKLGRKMLISGGGRCNVTNNCSLDEFIQYIPGNGRFLNSAFSQFSNKDLIDFFHKIGVPLKEEADKRMFPASNNAHFVVDGLKNTFLRLNGKVMMNMCVKDIEVTFDGTFIITTDKLEKIKCRKLIIAVGGKSAPKTGSTGDGYSWAKKLGHTITELFPVEVPLTSSETFIKSGQLQGLSLPNVAVSVLNGKGKKIITHQMDVLFTHFGLSGPAVLRSSQFVIKELKKNKFSSVTLIIDCFPSDNFEQLKQKVVKIIEQNMRKSVKNGFKHFLPERYLLFLLDKCNISSQTNCSVIPNAKWNVFIELVKKFTIHVDGSLPLEKAFVTGGGISVKEINPKTMESRLVPNLYFCGEILDIHGYTGGFNLSCAMITGRVAGNFAGTSLFNEPYF